MKKIIKIGKKPIGLGKPCFIIAEAGVNHNGDINLAKKLVDVAVNAGADAVKFQTFKAEGVVTKNTDIAPYAKRNIGMNLKQYDMIKKMELTYDEFKKLKKYCDKKNIIFLSTPHSLDAIDFLEDLIPAYKFGSGDLTNIPALEYAAKKHKPMILGTGMAALSEIRTTVHAIRKTGNNDIILLHCTTNYPCPFNEVNLRAMLTMQNTLNCLVGYSDHTLGVTVPIMASTLGAVVVEKHFTINKNLPGPDHKASLEPEELKTMVTAIRNVEIILGSYTKKPTVSEKKNINLVRKSIVAKKDIKKGVIVRKDMLDFKRPADGLSPSVINDIIGKKTKQIIKKDEKIQLKMVE